MASASVFGKDFEAEFNPFLEHTVVLDFCFKLLCCTYTVDDIIIFLYKSEVGAVVKPTQNYMSSTKEAQGTPFSNVAACVNTVVDYEQNICFFEEITYCPL